MNAFDTLLTLTEIEILMAGYGLTVEVV